MGPTPDPKPSTSKAIRMWLGKLVVDYIETFIALVPVQLLMIATIPTDSIADTKAAAYAWTLQLVAPAVSALISAGRRALVNAWPALKAWLLAGGSDPGANVPPPPPDRD